MKVWIEKPVSDTDGLTEGCYLATNGLGYFEVQYDERYGFHQEFTDCSGLTHYLVPAEGNFLTDQELEEVKKKAKNDVVWKIIESWQEAKNLDEDGDDAQFSYNDIEIDLYEFLTDEP